MKDLNYEPAVLNLSAIEKEAEFSNYFRRGNRFAARRDQSEKSHPGYYEAPDKKLLWGFEPVTEIEKIDSDVAVDLFLAQLGLKEEIPKQQNALAEFERTRKPDVKAWIWEKLCLADVLRADYRSDLEAAAAGVVLGKPSQCKYSPLADVTNEELEPVLLTEYKAIPGQAMSDDEFTKECAARAAEIERLKSQLVKIESYPGRHVLINYLRGRKGETDFRKYDLWSAYVFGLVYFNHRSFASCDWAGRLDSSKKTARQIERLKIQKSGSEFKADWFVPNDETRLAILAEIPDSGRQSFPGHEPAYDNEPIDFDEWAERLKKVNAGNPYPHLQVDVENRAMRTDDIRTETRRIDIGGAMRAN